MGNNGLLEGKQGVQNTLYQFGGSRIKKIGDPCKCQTPQNINHKVMRRSKRALMEADTSKMRGDPLRSGPRGKESKHILRRLIVSSTRKEVSPFQVPLISGMCVYVRHKP